MGRSIPELVSSEEKGKEGLACREGGGARRESNTGVMSPLSLGQDPLMLIKTTYHEDNIAIENMYAAKSCTRKPQFAEEKTERKKTNLLQ